MKTSLVLAGLLTSLCAAAQTALKTPQPSPAASVSQILGVTEVKVSYSRPAVGGRPVYGELVPYGEVWRAGANENTTVSFSTPVKVAKKVLPAGTYGLHMIPTAKEWTVIFSKVATGWGSYGYDPKEDALRFTVTPAASESFEERLSYRFDNVTEKSASLALRWEKLKVSIELEVDTAAETMASMRAQLRGAAQFSSNAWNQAATYWLENGGNLDEAQKFVERSMANGETFQNLSTRAQLAEKRGDAKLAAELRLKALSKASEADFNQLGYSLLGQKKVKEALEIFQKNVKAYPASWNAHDSLAETYLAAGQKKEAADNYQKALSLVKDPAQRKRIETTLARLQAK